MHSGIPIIGAPQVEERTKLLDGEGLFYSDTLPDDRKVVGDVIKELAISSLGVIVSAWVRINPRDSLKGCIVIDGASIEVYVVLRGKTVDLRGWLLDLQITGISAEDRAVLERALARRAKE